MVGNASGGDPNSYESMETSCTKIAITIAVIGAVLIGLIVLGLVELVKSI
jgi:hypothetical protein